MLDVRVLTIFPRIFDSFLSHGNPARAMAAGLLRVASADLRDFTDDRHRTTDDYPYGGGKGMIVKPEPVAQAIKTMRGEMREPRVILMTPQGKLFTQTFARELSGLEALVLVCGRYEGYDERIRALVDDEVSVGDYVLSGGETAAMVVIDAVVRCIPGVLDEDAHAGGESFYEGLLEYPQYTRPREFEGMEVPAILLDGHHERIRRWRLKQALIRTLGRRPDLLETRELSSEEARLLDEIRAEALLADTESTNDIA